jgi:hypothetical protein
MPLWFSESRRIGADVTRILVQDPNTLGRVGLKVARDDAKLLLDRIRGYQRKIRKRRVVARTASAANDGLTVVSGGVWAASLFGVAIFPPLALVASIATPVGAVYAIGDRALNSVRARRLERIPIRLHRIPRE